MNLLFSVFGVFVALFSVANGKKEKCLGSSLLEAKHFKFLPDLKRQDTVIKGENYCNLKDENSCCTEHELDTVKGWFVLADYYLSMEEYMNERLMKHPDDLYFITLGIVSQVCSKQYPHNFVNIHKRCLLKYKFGFLLFLHQRVQ
mmetsp:Transcript_34536/g.42565  ORF Transcript_34536/g.42565 Transcript_34536/m.42565 type:complete len:145 (-) Transcript_34536:1312-1746(-)